MNKRFVSVILLPTLLLEWVVNVTADDTFCPESGNDYLDAVTVDNLLVTGGVCLSKKVRWALFGILVLFSQNSFPWYPEFGSEISGVGSYDTTERQFILIAFNRIDNCQSVSLWLDGSLYNLSQAGNFNSTRAKLKVDGYQGWTLSFDFLESKYWLPRPWALRQIISGDLLEQLRHGNMLSVSINKHKYLWSLAGSNSAIKSAYKSCFE